MKIIDAFWEKRNLGVKTTEIIIEDIDTVSDIEVKLKQINTGYVVVKIDPAKMKEMHILQQYGYEYIESILSVEVKTGESVLPKIYERFSKNVTYNLADENMTISVLNEIKDGHIFKTDRIAMDEKFSQQIAGCRYYNWAKDELDKNAVLNIAYYKDIPVAFGISKRVDDNRQDNFLGGLLHTGEGKGLGFLALAANHDNAIKTGARVMETKVSSNNLPIIRLHLQYGYDIKKITYIFVKHF